MASLTINPTSNNFNSSGGTGSLAVNVETDNWHSTPQSGDIWMAQRKKTNGAWSSWAVFKILGEDGSDGKGIRSTAIAYNTSSYGTTPPSSGWRDSSQGVPSAPAGYYLWTRVTYTYTDNTTSVAYSVARQGNDGGSGSVSPALLYRGEFNVNPNTGESEYMTYYGNDTIVNVVYSNGQYWVAKSTAGTFVDRSSSPSSTYWNTFGASFDSVATGLVFAQEATIEKAVVRKLRTNDLLSKRVVIDGDTVAMYDSSNNQRMLITGEDLADLDDTHPQTSFQAKTATPSSGAKSVTRTFDLWTPSVSTPSNTLSLPALTARITRGSSSEDIISAEAAYLIDGEVVSVVRLEGYLTYNSTIDMSLPSKNLTLPTGSHTIQLRLSAETDETSLTNIKTLSGGTLSITYSTQDVEIGANGFRAAFEATKYAEFIKVNGTVYFEILNGSYGFRVTSSGIQVTTSGSSGWRTISL